MKKIASSKPSFIDKNRHRKQLFMAAMLAAHSAKDGISKENVKRHWVQANGGQGVDNSALIEIFNCAWSDAHHE